MLAGNSIRPAKYRPLPRTKSRGTKPEQDAERGGGHDEEVQRHQVPGRPGSRLRSVSAGLAATEERFAAVT